MGPGADAACDGSRRRGGAAPIDGVVGWHLGFVVAVVLVVYEREYREALRLDPRSAGAARNLAIVRRDAR
ncbi:MAG: hypothetical protein IT294_04370 [Deltaproteobacteria bacterium]|nr:hypothetical protein [Deltaproteobacteria bacterium]